MAVHVVPCAFCDKLKSFKVLYNTRILGRFALIFYLNCEHVYILKLRRKKFADF